MIKLTIISILTVLPILAFLVTILFEKFGCTGATGNLGAPIPDCMFGGLNVDPLYQFAGTITFFATILAPLTLVWIIGGSILLIRTKRATP
jgi:hypothetical protein